jgi:hypothetical protein
MKCPQVWLNTAPFLAIRADLNSSGIRESVQMQTGKEHSGLSFRTLAPSFFTAVEKAVSFQAEAIVQLRTSGAGR